MALVDSVNRKWVEPPIPVSRVSARPPTILWISSRTHLMILGSRKCDRQRHIDKIDFEREFLRHERLNNHTNHSSTVNV